MILVATTPLILAIVAQARRYERAAVFLAVLAFWLLVGCIVMDALA